MTRDNSAAFAAVAAELPAVPAGTLEAARTLVQRARDIDAEIADLEGRRSTLAAELFDIRTKKLVDLMSAVGIRALSVAAAGNLPGYEAKLKPYYKASISADWEPARRDAAFAWLEQDKSGDLIKHVFVIDLDRDSLEDADAVRNAMKVLGIEFTESKTVHHGTLTAWLKEQVEKKKRKDIPLDVIGAATGQLVEVKPLKVEK